MRCLAISRPAPQHMKWWFGKTSTITSNTSLSPSSLSFMYWACCHMVWSIPASPPSLPCTPNSLASMRAQKAEKTLSLWAPWSATPKIFPYYQSCVQHKSKTLHCTNQCEENLLYHSTLRYVVFPPTFIFYDNFSLLFLFSVREKWNRTFNVDPEWPKWE